MQHRLRWWGADDFYATLVTASSVQSKHGDMVLDCPDVAGNVECVSDID